MQTVEEQRLAGQRARALVRPMIEADLAEADRVLRLAFGTFLGAPDPMQVFGDSGYVFPRFRSDPTAAFVATVGADIVGSSFATRWGSVGFFGPLTVRPDHWDAGIGRQLMEPVLKCFERWGVAHAGLFTFAQSAKHVGFYQTLGFWPRFLTPIMARPVVAATPGVPYQRVSLAHNGDLERWLVGCRAVAGANYPGLDLTSEIAAVRRLGLGDTVLIENGRTVEGFAVCHIGAATEAGTGTCFVKFGAVRPGVDAPQTFERLLEACNALALAGGATKVVAGMNTARHDAYRIMLSRGFTTFLQGVTMHRPNEPGYSRPDRFVIDDWR